MSEENKVGYLITFIKQTSMLGESIQIQTNLPFGASQADISKELNKIGAAYDERLRSLNTDVLARTGKNLKEMGIKVPGFNED